MVGYYLCAKLLIVISSYLCCLQEVYSYRTGAPNSQSVCNDRLPHHHTTGGHMVHPQTATYTPYAVSVNVTSVNYNDVIEVKLSSNKNDTYIKGFVVQVLPLTDRLGFSNSHHVTNPVSDLHGITPVGTFLESESVKVLSCFGKINTATHTDDSLKRDVILHWKATPRDVFRPLIVRATILREYSVFWKDVSSAVITMPDIKKDGDPTTSWLKMISKTASSIHHGGGEKWKQDIRSRLKLGFKDMGNSNEGIITDYIAKSLPYKGQFRKGELSINNGLYHSKLDQNNGSLNINQLVIELLKGDFKFSDKILKYLNGQEETFIGDNHTENVIYSVLSVLFETPFIIMKEVNIARTSYFLGILVLILLYVRKIELKKNP